MHVLHLAAECAPLIQTGGLADVVGALPAALRATGVRASVVLPLYGGADGEMARRVGVLERTWQGDAGGAQVVVWQSAEAETPTFLIELPAFDGPEVYSDAAGDPLPDARFVAFQLAVLAWLRACPEVRPDVLHLHDHHTALVPALLRGDAANEAIADLPTVLTVHGADHQGVVLLDELDALGIGAPLLTALRSTSDPDDAVNVLRIGVSMADAVIAPSPTYARELRGDGIAPRGLGKTFRAAADGMVGILHGLDGAVWSPSRDAHLAVPFGPGDLTGKRAAKAAICRELDLDPARPLLTFIGRLMPENGVEILFEAVERLLGRTEASIAVLGLGPPEQEARLRGLAGLLRTQDNAGRLAVRLDFDRPLAHRLIAGADILLAPARTEPSARTAMIAAAYGTVPVGHAVGALRDVLCPEGEPPRGICFDGFATTPFVEAVQLALERMDEPEDWARLQSAGMTAEFSWLDTAAGVVEVYRRVLGEGANAGFDRDRFLVR